MNTGYLCLFLHAHLPFVRHPEEEYFLEENWLFEAITETYLPLLSIFEKLIQDKIPYRITMSLTPPLVSMLNDNLLRSRYIRHLNKCIELTEKEIDRTRQLPAFHQLAQMYHKVYLESKDAFINKYHGDLVTAFSNVQKSGHLEIVASCATHGFLPIIGLNPAAARAQINIGVDHYCSTFETEPKGFWLPECGYYPGVDQYLRDAGIKYFFTDSHGIVNADPRPPYSVYGPIYSPSGVAAFGRDWECSKQVWSAHEGYPGDFDYREYYKDIGHELDLEYIKPYIHPLGIRINTGIKYWRITGSTDKKEPYRPDWAKSKAAVHAGNFMFNREKQINHLASVMNRKPIVVAPYDAELFGHWWYEGPLWLDFLIRKIATDQNTISLVTPSDYLQEYPENALCTPSASSWGFRGYNEQWLDSSNDWIYRHLHTAQKRMLTITTKFTKKSKRSNSFTDGYVERALNTAARELLLAESSDWPFIMKTGTMVPYAKKRFETHIGRFSKIYDDLQKGIEDQEWLDEVNGRDTIFSDMELMNYYVPQDGPLPVPNESTIKKNNITKQKRGRHARRRTTRSRSQSPSTIGKS